MKVVYNGKEYRKINKVWYDSSYIKITEYKLLNELEEYIKNNEISMNMEDIDKQVLFHYNPGYIDDISDKIFSTFKREDNEYLNFFISYFKKKYKNLELKNVILCVAPGSDSIKCNDGNLEKFVTKIGEIYNCETQINLLLRKYKVEKTAFLEKKDRDFEKQYERQLASIKLNEEINVKDKEILIIDDIKVTGGTISACKDILLNAGARRVCYFVISETY